MNEIQGEHLNMIPYARGYYHSRDLIHTVWQAIENAGDWDKIFWDTTPGDTPVSTHGDLVQWVEFIHSKEDPKVLLCFQDKKSKALAGIVWFGRIKHDEAAGCIWVSPTHRGIGTSRAIVHLGLRYAFEIMLWKKIWALTPWPVARNLIKRCGFKEVVTLPGMYRIGTEPGDVYVLSIEEKDYGKK